MKPAPKIIVVCGPTAVGKTGFAISLAKRFRAEIVGADSMQIYKYMDIGTAKPTQAEQAQVRHHMVDVVSPDQPFDAVEYARLADEVICNLAGNNIIPFIVGGTGLYVKALIFGLFENQKNDLQLRGKLKCQAQEKGPAHMHALLAQKDPEAAERIHPNDTYRIIRALEVVTQSGKPISVLHADHGFDQPRYQVLKIGLSMPRPDLYERINKRVDLMLEDGLEEEVRHLLAQGFSPDSKAMGSLGYRHMAAYLKGQWSKDEMVRLLKRDHRRYAKRQMTWFLADPSIQWVTSGEIDLAQTAIDEFLRS
ncbi:MAG: tRNA (adenosine(37)-N6)-dimethylallyltransferase MiaA [Desulfobacteraceae bacterium]|nr:tRNA (adenosine(37)-N6)-dimethylallyltransferase MiaA [Desulfobacteraceae bacterium]